MKSGFLIGCIAFAFLCPSLTPHASAQGATAWVRRYHLTIDSKDTAVTMATDTTGAFIVAGNAGRRRTISDIVLIKYSGMGVPLWTNFYGGLSHASDVVTAITVDEGDNIYVTGNARSSGNSSGDDLVLLKYSSAGIPLWTNTFTSGGNIPYPERGKALVARSNFVYVVGETQSTGNGPSPDYVTLRYTSAGVPLWTNRFGWSVNQSDIPNAIALGPQGEVYVTGIGYESSSFTGGYTTVAYSAGGSVLWTNRYREALRPYSQPFSMLVDAAGNIYETGISKDGSNNYDFATVAYASDGTQLWVRLYDGPGNGKDSASSMIWGPDGNLYVTGSSVGAGSGNDYATIAYTPAGVPLWTNRFGVGLTNSDVPIGLATDGDKIFVTGSSTDPTGAQAIKTLAYSSSGVPLWTNSFEVSANGQASAVKIACVGGRVAVLATSSVGGTSDILTLAYSTAGAPLWTNQFDCLSGELTDVHAVATDKNGGVYVTGRALNTITLGYTPDGTEIWTNTFSSDTESLIAVDGDNNVYVVDGKFATVKYSSQGLPLWTNTPLVSGDSGIGAIKTDAANRIYIAGYQSGANYSDYRTMALSSGGIQLWARTHDGSPHYTDSASAIAIDPNGKVFVTGMSATTTAQDGATLGYEASNGNQNWVNRYGFDTAYGRGLGRDIAVAPNGNVYVVAEARQTYDTDDYATIAYSNTGVPLWTNIYSFSETSHDFPVALVTDTNSNVYVTGRSLNAATNDDYATVAYSPAGLALWTNRFDSGGADATCGIATDNQYIYVTGYGYSTGVGGTDIITIAYTMQGIACWTNRYDGPDHGVDRLPGKDAIAIVPDGVVVVGNSEDGLGIREYVTIKYFNQNQPPVSSGFGGATHRDEPLVIAEADMLAVVSDPEGGAVSFSSAAATSLNGGSVNRAGGLVTYTPPPGFVGGDQFNYTVSDSAGASSVVVAKVAVLPSGTRINAFGSPAGGAGPVALTFAGIPGNTWTVYRAATIDGPWTEIGSMTIPGDGLTNFQDTDPLYPTGFYRALKP